MLAHELIRAAHSEGIEWNAGPAHDADVQSLFQVFPEKLKRTVQQTLQSIQPGD